MSRLAPWRSVVCERSPSVGPPALDVYAKRWRWSGYSTTTLPGVGEPGVPGTARPSRAVRRGLNLALWTTGTRCATLVGLDREVTVLLEVWDEAWSGWRPAQGVAGDLARGGVVETDESAQVAEVPLGVLGSDGSHGNVETAGDRRGD